jgi:hypothetical protein
MIKRISPLLLLIFINLELQAQPDTILPGSNGVNLGIGLPLGEFGETHAFGLSLGYSRSKKRLGQMTSKPVKPFGFILNGALNYFFGKKETILYTSYKYPNYLVVTTYAGVIYNPCKKGNIHLIAGPFFSLYDSNLEVGIGLSLEGSYYLKSNFGISPVLQLLKHSGSNPLLVTGIKAILSR